MEDLGHGLRGPAVQPRPLQPKLRKIPLLPVQIKPKSGSTSRSVGAIQRVVLPVGEYCPTNRLKTDGCPTNRRTK